MQTLAKILNSPFGLLVAGAIISGVLGQYLASRWQQRTWLFQQRFSAEQTSFEKQLEHKYKTLEDINIAVAAILTHSQFVVVGTMKGLPPQQRNDLVRNYNEAVMRWETDFRLYAIRLRTLFSDTQLAALWDGVKKERDELDVAIYTLSEPNQRSLQEAMRLIETISNMTVELSQRMLAEINKLRAAA